jgi:hypothetical protein
LDCVEKEDTDNGADWNDGGYKDTFPGAHVEMGLSKDDSNRAYSRVCISVYEIREKECKVVR